MKNRMELREKNGRGKFLRTAVLTILMLTLLSATALAANEGWKQKGSRIYYYYTEADGESAGLKATGLVQIGQNYYYFNPSGVLQTGWIATEDGYRYFTPEGAPGVKGAMYTGLKTIGKYKFYFNKKTGVVTTGLVKVKKKFYYFNTSKKLGKRGRSLLKKWKTINGEKYYFGSDGVMARDCWVKNTYYVDSDGKVLKSTVTPDGYLVDADGKKVGNTKVNGWVKINKKYHYYDVSKKEFLVSAWLKLSGKKYYLNEDGIRVSGLQKIGKYTYYFNSKGVMQTGLVTIKGKNYYLNAKGRQQFNKTIDGYIIDADGIAVKDPNAKSKILIIPGHGQGDSGATSKWGYESHYTRQFAKLIYEELKSDGIVDVTYYKNGSINYDCYQQNAATFRALGLSGRITGSGAIKTRVKNGLKTNSNLPDFTGYDYVLEVHFNAKGSGKDPNGDGNYTGVGFYLNSYKSKYTLERNILSKIVSLGFKQWGSGVYASSTLFNARICQELGVSYGLLETAFIDDGDDMRFYTNNKSKMAKAVAAAIEDYYK